MNDDLYHCRRTFVKTHCIRTESDYIIVGQGLAGACLALQLIERGKKVIVFDTPDQNRSTIIAAGLFNPITGKVMARTWQADILFPYLQKFYPSWEKKLNRKFYYPTPLYRPFISVEEQNEWMAASEKMDAWIGEISTEENYSDEVHNPFGGILLKNCGYISTAEFLLAVKNYLLNIDSYQSEHFDVSEMSTDADGIGYKSFRAGKIIFCQGYAGNEYFHWLPLKPLKGETQTIELKKAPSVIFNRGVYVVPMDYPTRYKVGATYLPNDSSPGSTEGGRAEVSKKLEALLKIPYEVVEFDWGIRPSSPDRRPFLGEHPGSKNVAIFNGLGTKGVSLAPYFSAQMADWLIGAGDLQKEVNISRFNALYSK